MHYTILDCYTDEAAGLGVPPYLGTYPRYIAGTLSGTVSYVTIDDLRLQKKYNGIVPVPKQSQKTDIAVYNLTSHEKSVPEILAETDTLIIVLGVHVPGKYLSAYPGTLHEVIPLVRDLKCKKILTGPAVFGTQLFGGKEFEKEDMSVFDEVNFSLFNPPYAEIKKSALPGSKIVSQIPDIRMIEIETGRGCDIGHCSFCTEPLKNKVEFRDLADVLDEMQSMYDLGQRYFRFGKQTCFYTYPHAVKLLEESSKRFPEIKVLHIDNVNPVKVMQDKTDTITKAVVKHCTSGNIAAFGIESFDPEVVKANTLNTMPVIGYKAIEKINQYGSEVGADGLPTFLPGINIIFGLAEESKKTHEANMAMLTKIMDNGLMLRRINIRQAAIFEGTSLYAGAKDKFLKKNKKYYWKWRNEIRQKIDYPMLERVAPKGRILTNCFAEMYDGKTTFCRQFGTYPLIIGVKKRLPLKQFFDIEVTGHMLRSLVGKVC